MTNSAVNENLAPPKRTVPGLIATAEVLCRTDHALLWVPTVRVFPLGLTVDLELVHSRVEGNRQDVLWQDFSVRFVVDGDEEVFFTLGKPPLVVEKPFPSLFWKRSSSNYGITAAVWIGAIPDVNLRVTSLTNQASGGQLTIDRDRIVVAMRQIIELGKHKSGDGDGIIFLS
ncbi:MAG: hypothetical protein ACRDRS_22685 [Pseudonocardiaceae bacterium]